jgi:hypothetical protein
MSPEEVASALQCSVGIVKQYIRPIEEFGLKEQQVYDWARVRPAMGGKDIQPTAAKEVIQNERREQEPVAGGPVLAFTLG